MISVQAREGFRIYASFKDGSESVTDYDSLDKAYGVYEPLNRSKATVKRIRLVRVVETDLCSTSFA
jgi:hypothetical protein